MEYVRLVFLLLLCSWSCCCSCCSCFVEVFFELTLSLLLLMQLLGWTPNCDIVKCLLFSFTLFVRRCCHCFSSESSCSYTKCLPFVFLLLLLLLVVVLVVLFILGFYLLVVVDGLVSCLFLFVLTTHVGRYVGR